MLVAHNRALAPEPLIPDQVWEFLNSLADPLREFVFARFLQCMSANKWKGLVAMICCLIVVTFTTDKAVRAQAWGLFFRAFHHFFAPRNLQPRARRNAARLVAAATVSNTNTNSNNNANNNGNSANNNDNDDDESDIGSASTSSSSRTTLTFTGDVTPGDVANITAHVRRIILEDPKGKNCIENIRARLENIKAGNNNTSTLSTFRFCITSSRCVLDRDPLIKLFASQQESLQHICFEVNNQNDFGSVCELLVATPTRLTCAVEISVPHDMTVGKSGKIHISRRSAPKSGNAAAFQ